jgi:hypothetical protein
MSCEENSSPFLAAGSTKPSANGMTPAPIEHSASVRLDGSGRFAVTQGKSGGTPALARNRERGESSQAGNPANGESY